jgi:uncharacterized membrane protein YhaH (DUF805 family)
MGLQVFWDTEIPPGQTWADYIEGKLNQCKSVIVLWSQHSTKSQWVREEARMGREKAKLIPAMLDGSPMPFGFGEVQAADLSTWNGQADHPQWRRLSQAVYTAVNGADAPMPAPQAAPAPQARPQPAYTPPAATDATTASDSPIGYIQKCLRFYLNGAGRARRAEYGWFLLFAYVMMFVGAFIDVAASGLNSYTETANDNYIIMILIGLALACPAIAAASRRAHDFGQSGWLAILTAIPYIGFIAALAFIFIPGQPGENQYGPNPKAI